MSVAAFPLPQRHAAWKSWELVLHWRQLVALWLIFFINAGLIYDSTSTFLKSFEKEFDASDYAVSWLPAAFLLALAGFAVPAGYLAKAVGPTRCFQVGSLVAIVASCCYPFAPSLWVLGILYIIYGLVYALAGNGMVLLAAATRFDKQCGTAISFLLTAFSMGGVIMKPIFANLITQYGWRQAAILVPVLNVFVQAPLAFFVLADGHQSPASHTSAPAVSDNVEQGTSAVQLEVASPLRQSTADDIPVPASFLQSLKLAATWHIAALSFYSVYIIVGLVNELSLFLQNDAGLDLASAGSIESIVFALSMCGKLFIGLLLDSRFRRAACIGSYMLMIIGTSLPLNFFPQVAATESYARLIIFAVVYGFAFGNTFGVVCALPPKLFAGMRDLKQLQSFYMAMTTLGGFCGTLISGKLRTATGSYTAAFCIFLALAVLSLLHIVALEVGLARQRSKGGPDESTSDSVFSPGD
eukprot:TRINITY_DN42362_c0_g1_i2.p1 TRINITY_DN42362_c0_g1~~TRINITY_DN42362_c0_g1_i2.p1  ORF type:complete len:469 (-),score=50.69 TRINITY_DN42362_c0_g1_i2:113-1519(-)